MTHQLILTGDTRLLAAEDRTARTPFPWVAGDGMTQNP
jgi:hypothetical protein